MCVTFKEKIFPYSVRCFSGVVSFHLFDDVVPLYEMVLTSGGMYRMHKSCWELVSMQEEFDPMEVI